LKQHNNSIHYQHNEKRKKLEIFGQRSHLAAAVNRGSRRGDTAALPPLCARRGCRCAPSAVRRRHYAVPPLFAGDNARAPGKTPRIRRRAPWTPPLCARLDTPAPQDLICVCRVRWRSGEHMETIR